MTNYRKRQQAKEFKRQAAAIGFPMLAVSIMCGFIFLAFI